MRKSEKQLLRELERAATFVEVGGVYAHYKSPNMKYRVKELAIDTITDEPCIIYVALYGEKLTFTRPLHEWLDDVETQSGTVKRFTRVP
jgi:hypothetical protein